MAFEPATGALLRLSTTEGVRDVRSPAAAQLHAAVRSANQPTFDELPAAVMFHGVPAYAHEALGHRSDVPQVVREALRRARDRTAVLHLRTVADLVYLDSAFSESDLPWLVIKGPTLAEPVHGSAQHRSYGDLDVLVPAARFGQALEALEAAGSIVTDQNWTLIHREMKGEVHLRLPSGTALDLHWHLFNDEDRRRLFPISIEHLFRRSRHVNVSGQAVRTLSPADTIVYVALHALHSGGDRLIWLKDVERLLAQPDADPREVVDRARAWRAELPLLAMLHRVKLALGPPPQFDSIWALSRRHRTWLACASLAWRRVPAEREDGSGSVGRLVCRSTRVRQRDSFLELLRRGTWAWRERRGEPETRQRGFPAHDPRSGQYPSGGPATRALYLTCVAERAS